jgi:hypothetical protein
MSANPRRVADHVYAAFTDGEHSLRLEELTKRAYALKEAPTPSQVEKVAFYLPRARKRLEDANLCTILVTDFYYDNGYDEREVKKPVDAAMCCALHGRAAVGIRVMSLKDSLDDPLGITWLFLNQRCGDGIQAANLKRIVIQHSEHKLSDRQAIALIKDVVAFKMPDNYVELAVLLKKGKIRRLEGKNGK